MIAQLPSEATKIEKHGSSSSSSNSNVSSNTDTNEKKEKIVVDGDGDDDAVYDAMTTELLKVLNNNNNDINNGNNNDRRSTSTSTSKRRRKRRNQHAVAVAVTTSQDKEHLPENCRNSDVNMHTTTTATATTAGSMNHSSHHTETTTITTITDDDDNTDTDNADDGADNDCTNTDTRRRRRKHVEKKKEKKKRNSHHRSKSCEYQLSHFLLDVAQHHNDQRLSGSTRSKKNKSTSTTRRSSSSRGEYVGEINSCSHRRNENGSGGRNEHGGNIINNNNDIVNPIRQRRRRMIRRTKSAAVTSYDNTNANILDTATTAIKSKGATRSSRSSKQGTIHSTSNSRRQHQQQHCSNLGITTNNINSNGNHHHYQNRRDKNDTATTVTTTTTMMPDTADTTTTTTTNAEQRREVKKAVSATSSSSSQLVLLSLLDKGRNDVDDNDVDDITGSRSEEEDNEEKEKHNTVLLKNEDVNSDIDRHPLLPPGINNNNNSYGDTLTAMITDAVAIRQSRIQSKNLEINHTAAATAATTAPPSNSTVTNIATDDTTTTVTTTTDNISIEISDEAISPIGSGDVDGSSTLAAMITDAIAMRQRRIESKKVLKDNNDSSSSSSCSNTNNSVDNTLSNDAFTTEANISGGGGLMAAMIAEAVAKRQNRIEMKKNIPDNSNNNLLNNNDDNDNDDNNNDDDDNNCNRIDAHTINSKPETNNGNLSLAEMAAEAALKRKERREQQKTQQQQDNKDSQSNTISLVENKIELSPDTAPSGDRRTIFSSIVEEAAMYGRLVRLNEIIIEAEAPIKKNANDSFGNKAIDTWSGPKLLTDNRRSNAMRVIQEAAASGRLNQKRSISLMKQNNECSNNDNNEDSDDNFDIDNQFDESGRKVLRTNFLLDKHVQEDRNEKKERMWTSPETVFERDDKAARYKSFDDVELPTEILPTWRRPRHINSGSSDFDYDGDNDNINATCKPVDNEKSLNKMNQLRVLESLSTAVAASAWERNFRLQRPKAELRVTERCQCPYCKDPTPYQTHKYKRLMYPERFRNIASSSTSGKSDNSDKNGDKLTAENENACVDSTVDTHSDSKIVRVVKKKKLVRIVRRKKKNAAENSSSPTKRVIDGTSLSRDQLEKLQQQLQAERNNEMTTEELLELATELSKDKTSIASTGITADLNFLPKPSQYPDDQFPLSSQLSIEHLLHEADDLNYVSETSIDNATKVVDVDADANIKMDWTTEKLLQVANDLSTRRPAETKLNDLSAKTGKISRSSQRRRIPVRTASLPLQPSSHRSNNSQRISRARPNGESHVDLSRKNIAVHAKSSLSASEHNTKYSRGRNLQTLPATKSSLSTSEHNNQTISQLSMNQNQHKPIRIPPSRTHSLQVPSTRSIDTKKKSMISPTDSSSRKPTTNGAKEQTHTHDNMAGPQPSRRILSRNRSLPIQRQSIPGKSHKADLKTRSDHTLRSRKLYTKSPSADTQILRRPPNRTNSLPVNASHNDVSTSTNPRTQKRGGRLSQNHLETRSCHTRQPRPSTIHEPTKRVSNEGNCSKNQSSSFEEASEMKKKKWWKLTK